MLYLYLFVVAGMERMAGVVCRVGDVVVRGVPRGIDTGGEGRVGLEVYLADIAVEGHDGSAFVLAGMELQAVGVVVLHRVAVDALAILVGGNEHIAEDDALLVILQAALVDGQVFVGDVGGGDKAIGDVRINPLFGYADSEGLECFPFPLFLLLDVGCDGNVFADTFADEAAPFFDAGADVCTADGNHLLATGEGGDGIRYVRQVIAPREGRDVGRNSDVGIVRSDGGLGGALLEI